MKSNVMFNLVSCYYPWMLLMFFQLHAFFRQLQTVKKIWSAKIVFLHIPSSKGSERSRQLLKKIPNACGDLCFYQLNHNNKVHLAHGLAKAANI